MTKRNSATAAAPIRHAVLRLLATTDLHVHVHSWDYFTDQPSAALGLARTAGLIREARAEVANTLLFDNGDFLVGSPLGDLIAAQHRNGRRQPHPIIAAMNLLAYDAVTIGNHEFAHGIDYLTACLQDANFPVVSTNMLARRGATPLEDRPLFAADLLLTREILDDRGEPHPIRIGVLGFAPTQTVNWEHHALHGQLQVRDILEAAAARIPILKAAGAEIILALCHSGIGHSGIGHSGIGPGAPVPVIENVTTALAALIGIDVLVAGHTHQQFPGPDFPQGPGIDPVQGTLWGKPAVMPGFFGSHLGVIDLDLRWQGGVLGITGHRSRLRAIAQRLDSGAVEPLIACDPALEAATEADHAATRRWSSLHIGRTDSDLHSFFAMVSACPAVRLVARAQRDYVREALLGTALEATTVLSAAAPFRAGGRGGPENYTFVPRGEISMRNLADLYSHPNAIAAVALSGVELRGWLERSASQFHQIHPGAVDAELIDQNFSSFNFDSIEGLSYRIDLSSPARFDCRGQLRDRKAWRITDLRHQGQAVQPKDRFIVATNSYRTGGGGFAGASAERVVLSRPDQNRDILRQYIAAHDPLPQPDPPDPPNWRFLPMPGTAVSFDSSPLAADHLADVPELRLQVVERRSSGFLRFRLQL